MGALTPEGETLYGVIDSALPGRETLEEDQIRAPEVPERTPGGGTHSGHQFRRITGATEPPEGDVRLEFQFFTAVAALPETLIY